jgi:hypothetical protein
MFTVGALLLTTTILWFASKMNDRDQSMYDRATPDDRVWILVLHVRQDLKLITFFLLALRSCSALLLTELARSPIGVRG